MFSPILTEPFGHRHVSAAALKESIRMPCCTQAAWGDSEEQWLRRYHGKSHRLKHAGAEGTHKGDWEGQARKWRAWETGLWAQTDLDSKPILPLIGWGILGLVWPLWLLWLCVALSSNHQETGEEKRLLFTGPEMYVAHLGPCSEVQSGEVVVEKESASTWGSAFVRVKGVALGFTGLLFTGEFKT